MNSIIQLVMQHQVVAGATGLWVFSALVGTMPDPTVTSGTAYIWLYRFLHTLSANLDKAAKAIPTKGVI
jgi:hypothetical protein